jgi:type VI protein secretion system component VasK
MSSADVFGQILAYALTAVLWAWLWLHIITKIGYRGLARRLWLVSMCIPPFLGIAWILLFLLPWPVHRELRQLKKESQKVAKQADIDDELERMKRLK